MGYGNWHIFQILFMANSLLLLYSFQLADLGNCQFENLMAKLLQIFFIVALSFFFILHMYYIVPLPIASREYG
jgi:hypothetical protein